MEKPAPPLSRVFEGWDGYNTSLIRAVQAATPEALAYRIVPDARSSGEIARHLWAGRLNWFSRMDAPGSAELAARIKAWHVNAEGNRFVDEGAQSTDPEDLVYWLSATWGMIEQTLAQWTVDDLFVTYRHTYFGRNYAVSRQWTIWRILSHDIHHGGQLTVLLGSQGIALPELADLGGHLTEPPLAELRSPRSG